MNHFKMTHRQDKGIAYFVAIATGENQTWRMQQKAIFQPLFLTNHCCPILYSQKNNTLYYNSQNPNQILTFERGDLDRNPAQVTTFSRL